MKLADAFKQISDVVIDAYYLTDRQGHILDYNRAFFGLFPRKAARKLKGMPASDAMPMERDVAKECMDTGRHVRLDEIPLRIPGSEQELRVILSAVPLKQPDDSISGSLVILRNVTDEAQIQLKYQEMLDNEARERERLAGVIEDRTSALVDANELLLGIQREMMEYKQRNRVVSAREEG